MSSGWTVPRASRFVTGDQYMPVIERIEEGGYQLRPPHVIAQEAFLSSITKAVESLRGVSSEGLT